MKQYVLVTGTGRPMALGFNFVLRYLEQGADVIATVRKPSEGLNELQKQYPDTLHILEMDVGSTSSVKAAYEKAKDMVPCLDTIINNAVTTSSDTNKELEEFNLDDIPAVINVDAVGPLRVVKEFMPLMKKSPIPALIVNISSEAGSIGKCYRSYYLDYGMAKAGMNMSTKALHNKFKDDPMMNIICVHPGWMHTNEGNAKAPFEPYDHAETMRLMFETKRTDKDGPIFVTWAGEEYPW